MSLDKKISQIKLVGKNDAVVVAGMALRDTFNADIQQRFAADSLSLLADTATISFRRGTEPTVEEAKTIVAVFANKSAWFRDFEFSCVTPDGSIHTIPVRAAEPIAP
ncbi:MAG: hypothetical protein GC137_06165 [Alphaproteobacteria bacterium]|nr:hypothetical protein [Alphaproteobacteria bacterium]